MPANCSAGAANSGVAATIDTACLAAHCVKCVAAAKNIFLEAPGLRQAQLWLGCSWQAARPASGCCMPCHDWHSHLLCLRCVVHPQLLCLHHNCPCQSHHLRLPSLHARLLVKASLGKRPSAAACCYLRPLTRNSLSKGLTAGWPVSAANTPTALCILPHPWSRTF
jgi:hypothetical protein